MCPLRQLITSQPRFRRLFLAQCASFAGDAAFLVAAAFAVLAVTPSERALGLVMAAGSLGLVLGFVISGVWADRLPPVPLLVLTDLARAATQGAFAWLVITHHATVPALAALTFASNLAAAFFWPARTVLIPRLLTDDDLVAANSLLSIAQHATSIGGWALGGLIVAAIGPGWTIALDAASFAASALLLLGIGATAPRTASAPSPTASVSTSFRTELVDGFRELRAHRWIWYTVLVASAWILFDDGAFVVLYPIAMDRYYDGALTWGVLGAVLSVGGVIGAWAAAQLRIQRPMRIVLPLIIPVSLVPAALALSAPLWILAIGFALTGVTWACFDSLWHADMQRLVAPDKLARVSAWDALGSYLGAPLGMALAGWLGAALGLRTALLAAAAGTVVCAVALIASSDVRRIGARTGLVTDASGTITP